MYNGGGVHNGYYEPYWTEDELEHFGIKGMKWGIRRYQNPDGTLTEAGKKRYGSAENFEADRERKRARNQKIAKTAKTTAKVAAVVGAVGFGLLAPRLMQVSVSNAVNTSVSREQLKMIDDWMIKNGTVSVGGVIVGRPSNRNQGKFSPSAYNKIAQSLVDQEWAKYQQSKAFR